MKTVLQTIQCKDSQIKDGSVAVLVATDIASRGIDVNQLACVINFELAYVPEDYVHHIGRTGPASNSGLAVSLFSEEEYKQLQSIERKFEREVVRGFEPSVKGLAHPSEDEEMGTLRRMVEVRGIAVVGHLIENVSNDSFKIE